MDPGSSNENESHLTVMFHVEPLNHFALISILICLQCADSSSRNSMQRPPLSSLGSPTHGCNLGSDTAFFRELQERQSSCKLCGAFPPPSFRVITWSQPIWENCCTPQFAHVSLYSSSIAGRNTLRQCVVPMELPEKSGLPASNHGWHSPSQNIGFAEPAIVG